MRVILIHGSSGSTALSPHIPSQPLHHNPKHRPSKLSFTAASPNPPSAIPTVCSRALSTVRRDLSPSLADELTSVAAAASCLADGRLEEFAAVADRVIESGVSASAFVAELDVEMVEKGLCRGLRDGKLWSFIEVLRKFEELGVQPLKVAGESVRNLVGRECRRLLACGDVKELVNVMEILSGFQFPIKPLMNPYNLIKVCIDQRRPVLAIRYACTLPHAQILFCTIMKEFGMKKDLTSALQAYEACKQTSVGPNMFIYRTMIDACGACGDYERSRYIYEDLLNHKVTPNVYVFNSLMNVNAHDLFYTLHIHKDMQNMNVKADMTTYNILLKSCCLAARVDLAQDIYREVQYLESTGALKLDVFTYSTIIKVFAEAKLWQMALKIKDDMVSAGVTPNTVTWSALISACANAGLVEEAIQLYEEMLEAECEPNFQCCNTLLHACVESCQYDRAFRLFEAWRQKLAKTSDGEWQRNKKEVLNTGQRNQMIFPEGISSAPTTSTYNILMRACGTDYHRAKSLMEEMRTAGLAPNNRTWSILINICGGTGNVEAALQILETMHAAKVKPDIIAYTAAIKVCVESEHLKSAFSLFEEMKRNQIEPNLVTYNTLLRARSKYGSLREVQQCLNVYQEMRRAGYSSNDYYLKQLIEEWCEGVIQGNNPKQEEVSLSSKTVSTRTQSFVLEKIASHLQKSVAESLAVDLRGLTKVEARIVVLAVLRMIKENYSIGNPVRDDVTILLGVSEVNPDSTDRSSEIKDAIIDLLRVELDLEVLQVGPKTTSLPLGIEAEPSRRRPAVLQRLKVTRKSLHQWLQRRPTATSSKVIDSDFA